MSTKTTFKRIALVAVAALGLGVLSVAPSSATPTGVTVTVTDGTAGLPNAAADSTTAGIINIAGLLENTDSVTVEIVLKSYPAGAATPAGLVYLQNLDSTTAASTATYTVDTTTAANAATAGTFVVNGLHTFAQGTIARIAKGSGSAYVSHNFGVQFDSTTASARVAGTYTYTALVKTFAAGATTPATTTAKDISIVIAAKADASKTPSAVTSFANLNAAGTTAQAAVGTDAVISAVSTAGTVAGYIYVGNRNAANGVLTAQDSLTATVTGTGVVCSTSTTLSATPSAVTCGKSIKVSASAGDYQFIVQADGTAGASTIVVTSGVAGWSVTKSVSFYAKAAKTITASVFTPILGVGTNDSAVVVTAVDANGTNWAGTAYIVATAAADALIGGSATTPVACVASADGTKQYCPVSTISTGTANFTVIDASTVALATATSNAVAVKVTNSTAATVKIAFDKATYAPFEKAIITVTPLDSSGNAIQAVSGNYLAAALTSNVALTIAGGTTATLPGASITTVAYAGTDKTAGSLSYVVYMPAGSGTVTLTGKGGAALPLAGQVAVTASATVVNASVDAATDAANEATDAANAATDAALAAADAADAATAAAQDASDAVAALSASVEKLVASLKAQLTSLTNLVIKIQKKVKA
jgi:hypothetical protein